MYVCVCIYERKEMLSFYLMEWNPGLFQYLSQETQHNQNKVDAHNTWMQFYIY